MPEKQLDSKRMPSGILRIVGLSILAGALCGLGVAATDHVFAQPQMSTAAAAGAPGPMCIEGNLEQTLEECPSNVPSRTKGARPGAIDRPTSRLRTATREKEETKRGPSGPSIELDAATRRNRDRIEARAAGLLAREVRTLQRLVRNTNANNPRRPDILLRLAETYFEQQVLLNAKVRSFDEPIFQAREAKNRGQVQKLMQEQREAQQGLKRVREQSIRAYATLVQDHPDFRRMDEVLFSLAFGLEELKQFDRARQVYFKLIKGYPQSRFVPHAWLSFAEFYFNEGDMRAATQFYGKVTEFPPDRNPVYGYALYKSAWADYNVEDYRGSLEKFVKTVEFGMQNPDARDAANLVRQARKEMVLPYSQVGNPNKALEFFRRYTEDLEAALKVLENLGELYFDTGQWEAAISVYQRLIAEKPQSDQTCYWQTRIASAIVSSKPKPDQVREAQRLVDLYDTYAAQNHAAEPLKQCKQEAAAILIELATGWHREAIGTDDSPGTNDKKTMALAARLYRMVIDKFPDLGDLEFPNIDRRDWPTPYRVAYYYAELLWKLEEWAQCGPAFDRVVELNPEGEYTSDAAYAAVLCYNNLYQQQYTSREREVRSDDDSKKKRRRGRRGRRQAEPETPSMQPREFTQLEQGMLRAFQRYVCFIPDSDDLPTIKYRRARIYYEANHFEEAAVIFKDIAWNHRDSDLSVYAANLYLDSLNVMSTQLEPKKPQCLEDLKESIDPLFGFYCSTPDKLEENDELCSVLQQLRCDVLRKQAEVQQESEQYEAAASTYVSIVKKYRECGKLDEVLYNAAINYEAAKLLGKAINARKILIRNFPQSDLAKKAVFLIGANFHALAIYSQAAEYYEQFAREFPNEDGKRCTDKDVENGTCAIAHEALQNAVFFRLGLGQEDKAIEDAKLFERNYKRKLPLETSQVIFSLGTIYKRQKAWTDVVNHYKKFLSDYGRKALPNQVIKANVEIAMAFWNARDRNKAQKYFEDAIKAWNRGAENTINTAQNVDDAQKAAWLLEAKDAASEAFFHLAEYKFAEFKRIGFPELRGGRDMGAVNKWAEKKFKPWVMEKQKAALVAQKEYEKIAGLQVPRWEIAAAARIGEMWRTFVDEFRDAPVPREIERDPELYDIYVGALDEQSEAFVQRAKGAFEFCLITSTRVRWFNKWSQQCERELFGLDPQNYPMAAELRGAPNFVHGTFGMPAPVELGAGGDDDEALEGGDQQ